MSQAILKTAAEAMAHVEAQKADGVHATPPGRKPPIAVAMPESAVKKVPELVIVGAGNADTQKANKKADYAKGEGAAEWFVKTLREHGASLLGFLHNIADNSADYRQGLRVALDKHLADMKAYVDERIGKPDFQIYNAAYTSARPRISEAIGFTKAIDLGWLPMWEIEGKKQGYHAMIGQNVAFRHSQSAASAPVVGEAGKKVDADASAAVKAAGPTRRRGRQPKPLLDKLADLLSSTQPTVAEMEQMVAFLQTRIELAKKAS